MRRFLAIAVFTLPLGASGACCGTDIGCSDGIVIRFDRAPTSGFRVTLVDARDTSATWSAECPTATYCSKDVFFPDATPRQLLVRVTANGRVSESTRLALYSSRRPNGALCGPECRIATVQVPFPE